jgi:hypothetical protein
MGSDDTDTNY